MSSSQKPWELNLENPPDSRVAEPKETDGLLSDKDCERFADHNDNGCSLGLSGFMASLNKHFGYKVLWLLFAAQFLIKGFVSSFIGAAEPYLYKLYGVPASQMQIYNGVTALPWAMKPIIGLASDILPIGGYNKAPYMLATSVVGVFCLLLVGLVPSAGLPLLGMVICFFFIQLQASAADLLSEAKYAEKMRDHPTHGPALMTYVWSGMQVGALAAVLGSGVIIARFGPRAVYAVAAVAASTILVPLALNYLEETPLSHQMASEARARFMAQKETCFLCALMFVSTIVLAVVGLLYGPNVTAVVAVIVAVLVLAGFSVTLNPVIAKFNAFSLIQTSLSLSVGGAAFYFFTDTPEQYPDGPHFTPFFYNSVMGVVSSIFSLVGIYCYQRFMSTWRYRNVLIATNLAASALSVLDIMMFTRLNVKIGVPDHVFVLGASVMQQIIMQWQWMPQVVILAHLCPKGMEATMYALLAGCHNLGNVVASNCGAVLLERLGCTPRGQVGESGAFDNLWRATAISAALPLVTILALFWLIPECKQNEAILDESEQSATAGSLWRRWTGKGSD